MDKKDIEEMIGKKVKVVILNEWFYSGIIHTVGEDYLKLLDKFDKLVFININQIKIIEVKE